MQIVVMRILTGAALALSASAVDVEKLLKSMTLEEKIGQLNQITINEFLSAPAQINYTKVSLSIPTPPLDLILSL